MQICNGSIWSRRFRESSPSSKNILRSERFFLRDYIFNVTTDDCVIKKDSSSCVIIRKKISHTENIVKHHWQQQLQSWVTQSRLAPYRSWTIVEIILPVQRAHAGCPYMVVYQNCLCNYLRRETLLQKTLQSTLNLSILLPGLIEIPKFHTIK